jgi:hypothetical protein
MELINGVFELSEKFMLNPRHVKLNEDLIRTTADVMLETGITPFPPESTGKDEKVICLQELVASSINYCYWYGTSNIRPNNTSSTLMYDIVNEAFDTYDTYWPWYVKTKLAGYRFPLLEDRVRHVEEVYQNAEPFVKALLELKDKEFYPLFNDLVLIFPGFASDMFLKRASLFFLQLYRTLGWFEEEMKLLPVPADYQVPNMLRHYGCIEYDQALARMIWENQLITKHSQMECEIRAATVLAGKKLQELTGWNTSEIDAWLWLRRKEASTPFHLTITTDY